MFSSSKSTNQEAKWSPDTCQMADTVFQYWGQFHLGKRTDKIEHEGMGTCARIEISQDVDNADQK